MDYEQMKRALLEYNWDDGFEFPKTLLDSPLCDLSLALQIFDLADGYSYIIGAPTPWMSGPTSSNPCIRIFWRESTPKPTPLTAPPIPRFKSINSRKMESPACFSPICLKRRHIP